MGAAAGGRRLKTGLVLLVALAAIPIAVLGTQVLAAQGEPGAGCATAVYVPPAGPIRLRLVLGGAGLADALDVAALEAYLADRTGREVDIVGVDVAGADTFEAYAAQRRAWDEVLVFFADAPRVEGIVAADGTAGGLGYAQENGACVRVAFVPGAPVPWTDGAGQEHGLQKAYAYLAHELGHVFGLRHSPEGIMGHGAYRPGDGDTFSGAQRTAFARVGA